MTISYEPQDFNELTVFFRWRGSILPSVLCKPAIWLMLFAHTSFYYLHMYRADIRVPELPWKLMIPPTALLTFFLVFYSGQCFTRYYQLYAKCTGMASCITEITGLLRVHFPEASYDALYNLCRLPVASVYLLYFQLSGGGSDGGKLVTDGEWKVLLQTSLLSESEVQKLKAFKGFRPFLLHTWALRAIQDRLSSDTAKGPGAAYKQYEAKMLKLNVNASEIVHMITQPIPFPYYHTLTLMLSLTLLLMAYALVQFETMVTFPTFFIICLISLGLKETAVALADPFGGDDVSRMATSRAIPSETSPPPPPPPLTTTGSLNSSCFSHLVLLASCLLRVPIRSGGLRDGAVHGEHPQRHEVADRRRRRVPSCVHVAAPRSRGDRGGQGEVGRGTEI